MRSILGYDAKIAINDELKNSIIMKKKNNYFVGKSPTNIDKFTVFTKQSIEELKSNFSTEKEFQKILSKYQLVKIPKEMLESLLNEENEEVSEEEEE